MPHNIDEDHQRFHDVYAGRKRKALKKWIENGQIFKRHGKNGKIVIPLPRLNTPHIVFGDNNNGVGRGEGKPGDIIGKEDPKGQGKGGGGEGESDGIDVQVDLEEVYAMMAEVMKLPNLKPKENDIFDEIQIKYNNISLNGPESLRHNRRTLLQALKRQCSDGSINILHQIPGRLEPMKIISPINSDKRYRQYREIKKPSQNAVIFFARDGSGSMSADKCEIANDIAWWIDAWIRRFYKRVERCYVWHDVVAKEVDEATFYRRRDGGGTKCSSAFKLIAKQFENRFPPKKWNIYVIYFTDGENWGDDNDALIQTIKEEYGENEVNLVGIAQILPSAYGMGGDDVKGLVDKTFPNAINIRTTEIGASGSITDEQRGEGVKKAIIDILGERTAKKSGFPGYTRA